MKAIRRIKKAQDGATTTPKKTWQQMTAGEKGAKKVELVKKGGIELFNKYKDSISKEAMGRREAEINDAASKRGMTRDEYAKWYKKNKNKPDVGIETCGPNFNSTKCGVSKQASKESKSDWAKKKNGGAIKKAQKGKKVFTNIKEKDNAVVVKPKRKPEYLAEKSNYVFLKSSEKGKSPTKKDSINYDRGYNIGRKNKQSLFMASDMNTYMGSVEGAWNKNKPRKKLKSGGSVKAKDGKWIQKATASIKRRGTKGVCTGSKFGGPTCKPGSKRYNLAKVFKGMAKKKK